MTNWPYLGIYKSNTDYCTLFGYQNKREREGKGRKGMEAKKENLFFLYIYPSFVATCIFKKEGNTSTISYQNKKTPTPFPLLLFLFLWIILPKMGRARGTNYLWPFLNLFGQSSWFVYKWTKFVLKKIVSLNLSSTQTMYCLDGKFVNSLIKKYNPLTKEKYYNTDFSTIY